MTLAAMLPRMIWALGALCLVDCTAATTVTQRDEELRSEAALDGKVRLRLLAGNLSSGTTQSYDTGEGMRILQGVHPDVAMLQEFNYGQNSDAEFRSLVDQTFGADFHYYRGAQRHIPNGIISRYPIVAGGEWEDTVVPDRALTWAHIDIPGDKDLWAISVHLSTSNAANRNTEANLLVAGIKASIPAADYLVIGGDFNTRLRSEPVIQVLSQFFVTTGPYPVDRQGNDKTNAARAKPYDWVMADADLNQYEIPMVLGSSTFTNGLVVDTRVYSPLDDIAPAKAADSASLNMQHMAVVRDFAVPAQGGDNHPPPPPPPPPAPTGAAHVVLTEVLANEPGTDTSAELVALTNLGGAEADLSSWTLSDSSRVRHVFAAGTSLAPGAVIRVYGRDASTGTLALSNGGDSVIVQDGAGVQIDRLDYTSALAGTDGVAMILGDDGTWSLAQ